MCLCSGYRTASVIIALTDGELHEDLFFYSEREVSVLHLASQGGRGVSGLAALKAEKGKTSLPLAANLHSGDLGL